MTKVIYGNELAKRIKDEMAIEIDKDIANGQRRPCLCVILVGDDPASVSYVKGKDKACKEIGVESKMIALPFDTTQEQLLQIVDRCNHDDSIDGILVQLPLPKHINEKEVLYSIDPSKDVDGLHPVNVAKLYSNEDGFVPCTPMGVVKMIEEADIDVGGKHVVVVGRSKLVGSPVSRLLLNMNATVTMCHSHTVNLANVCSQADILVVCVGKAKMITKEYVKEGACVIDVGVNRVNGKLCGDVDFDDVYDKCSVITPVPKGVGPMTICMLLKNTLKAYNAKF